MNVSTPTYVEIESVPIEESSAFETLLLVLPSVFYTFLSVINTSVLQNSIKNRFSLFLLEFLVIVIPIILNVTVTAYYVKETILTFNALIAIYYYYLLFKLYKLTVPKSKNSQKTSSLKNYITNARSVINLISVIAILAVDFKVFPRKFAKTDTFGYSLMDLGVGLYVFSNGIVSPEVRGQTYSIKKSLQGSLVLFLLGIGRFVTTSLVNYHVPVKEYGRHWNFFITLAFTKVFTSFFLNVVHIKYIVINAVALVLSHEILLQAGLQSYVVYGMTRDNIIAANKEGLVSTTGFVCIYLFSVYIGHFICYRTNDTKKTTNLKFMFSSALFLLLTYVFQVNFGISRKLANASYCCWVLFIGVFMTWLFYICENINEVILKEKLPDCVFSPYIFDAINYNGLVFFLIGNVLTGLINLTLNTMAIQNVIALFIITMYMFVNCLTMFLLHKNQIKLKL